MIRLRFCGGAARDGRDQRESRGRREGVAIFKKALVRGDAAGGDERRECGVSEDHGALEVAGGGVCGAADHDRTCADGLLEAGEEADRMSTWFALVMGGVLAHDPAQIFSLS